MSTPVALLVLAAAFLLGSTATVVLFLLHVPVWSTLVGLPSDGIAAAVLGNAYVWAAWGLLLFLPVGTGARATDEPAPRVARRGVSVP